MKAQKAHQSLVTGEIPSAKGLYSGSAAIMMALLMGASYGETAAQLACQLEAL